MTLRTTPEQDAKITEAAARRGVSKQAFVLKAVLDAADEWPRRRELLTERLLAERGEVLDRLGRA